MEHGCGGGGYRPYFDPHYDSLTERINPPSVSVDNKAYDNCTVVKVGSANKHGILLEMVQVLTDLDLVISKSYISSDGGWFMDVFHVTDQFGFKLSDSSLISYIQQSLISERVRSGARPVVQTCLGRMVVPEEAMVASPSSEYTAVELTGTDRPGLLSELSAVLVGHDCSVVSAQAWTHNTRAACIVYVGEHPTGGPVRGKRLAELEEKLEQVVAAHHGPGERWRVSLQAVVLAASQIRTERRLHQLMHEDRDFEEEGAGEEAGRQSGPAARKMAAKVSIESCTEKGYSVVGITSKDRPKLLFDTVCTLTDMNYVVFHATVSSHGVLAVQEYFIRRMDGLPLESEAERGRVSRCLVAAIERRVSHGLRLNVCTLNRVGILSDVTRVFREHGLSVTGAEIDARGEGGERAVGTFYVVEASGGKVDLGTVDSLRQHVGGTVALEVDSSPGWPLPRRNSEPALDRKGTNAEERARFSLGSLFWSHIGRLSNNFGSIKS